MTPLHQHIKTHYGSVYRAARETGKHENQIHRWLKAGAYIDDNGVVFTPSAGGQLPATPTTPNNCE